MVNNGKLKKNHFPYCGRCYQYDILCASVKKGIIDMAKKTRHGRYKVGTCKLTVTVENEDKLRVHRKALNNGYKDDSAFLRALIHEAVWDEPLLPEDYDALKKLQQEQEG